MIGQCRSVFLCDSDCPPFIHYCFKWEITKNLPYMKEIGVENIYFQDFSFFLAFQDSSNENSRSLLDTHMTKESKKIHLIKFMV